MTAAAPINLTHQFLIAMPGMRDGSFSGTVVYLCEHNERGALGLVINRPTTMGLGELFDKVDLQLGRDDLRQVPVYWGGPVETERGFVLHEPVAAVSGDGPSYKSTLAVPGGLAMTTSRDVLEAMAGGAGPQKVLVTLGYSGWGAGQLEDEMAHNGWLNVAAEPAIIFDAPVDERYTRALGLLGVRPDMLSTDAGHA